MSAPDVMSAEQPDSDEENRAKRKRTILGAWRNMVGAKMVSASKFELNRAALDEAVEYYLSDVEIIRKRYRIPGRINVYKVAGLTTAAILRYRPVVFKARHFSNDTEQCANEYLALLHGLSICAGPKASQEAAFSVMKEPWFRAWADDFIFLLHRRQYTSEGLSMIYQTLGLAIASKKTV